MLLIGTPNPAVDRTMVISGLRLGERHRACQVLVTAGGKGLNVARTAKILGQRCRVCAPLGGWTGQYLAHLASREGIDGLWSWVESGETRTCVLVVDPQANDATPLDEPGPHLSHDDWERFAATMLANAPGSTMAVLAGSLPPGVPPEALTQLISNLSLAGCPVLVDTSGEPLRAACKALPYGVKVNEEELLGVMDPDGHRDAWKRGQEEERIEHIVSLLQQTRQLGVELAIASLGGAGAVGVGPAGAYYVRPPAVPIVSTVGSGDALTAGLATRLLHGDTMANALRYGVACGTANALTLGGGRVILADIERIFKQTTGIWL